MNDFIEIEILKFTTLCKRKDIKSPQWFAMEIGILEHPDFLEIDGNEFKAYVWIVGIAVKLNKSKIRVYPELFQRLTTVNKKHLLSSIEKLKGKRFASRDPYARVTESVRACHATLQNTTKQNTTKNTIVQKRVFLNDTQVESYYQLYPKKVGKKKGNEKLLKLIKNQANLDQFEKAFKNYLDLCRIEEREQKYIKGWSVFVNQYEDYLDVEISEKKKDPANEIVDYFISLLNKPAKSFVKDEWKFFNHWKNIFNADHHAVNGGHIKIQFKRNEWVALARGKI